MQAEGQAVHGSVFYFRAASTLEISFFVYRESLMAPVSFVACVLGRFSLFPQVLQLITPEEASI
jgi:hypothetical protein